MKILVTGGAGFIGSHLVLALHTQGHEVVVLDNLAGGDHNLPALAGNCTFINGDVCSRPTVKNALKGVERIYHMAAHAAEGQSVYLPVFNAQTNIMGSLVVLTEALAAGVRSFVFPSSIAAYGKPEHLPVTEDHPLHPEDPYGITKMAFEKYLALYHELGYLDPVIFRFYNVFGPLQRMDDPYRGVVPIFINKCMKGEPPIVFGDGLQQRALTYISDVIGPLVDHAGNRRLINNPLNIGGSEVWTVKQLAEAIISAFGMKQKPQLVEARKTDVKAAYCDTAKARELIGYKARMPVTDGLQKTVAWVRQQGVKEFRYMKEREIPALEHTAYVKKAI